MGCTRNLSRILGERGYVFALIFALTFPFPSNVWAAFATQFSFTTGEAYSDNIFFSKDREHDFITFFTPTLTLLYAPEGQVSPTLNVNVSPRYEIYARHSDLNNFDNIAANAGYTYQYSPRLNFYLSDTFQRQGKTRTSIVAPGTLATNPTPPASIIGVTTPSPSQNLKDFTSGGTQMSNSVALFGSFLYRPDVMFTAGYTNNFDRFIDAGGTDVFHSIDLRGTYNWRQDHNLHAGYTLSIGNARNGDNGVIHNFDIGDSYFTNYNIQLTPTLSLAASSGLSLNTGGSGPRVANNTTVTITKLWETAQVNGGVTKGLTPSFGISGISNTTSLFANFNWRLSERLSATSSANFSFWDTDDVNFKTFQAGLGFQYLFTSWLSSGLNYYFNWIDSGAGADSTDLIQRGVVKSNGVFATMTIRFDVWPNTGLARTMSSPALSSIPTLLPPFSTQAPKPAP
jgi:hypothetical protein